MSTLSTICDNASRVKDSGKTGTTVNVKRIPYSRSSAMEHMGKMLSTWIKDRNLFVPDEDPLVDVDNAKPFNASSRWFCNYMKKYNFRSIKMRGEAASAVTAEDFVMELQYLTGKGIYSPKFIFSINETAVSGKKVPSRT